MQRYRINYHWLIGFFASFLVLAVTSYFVWSWQVERKAGNFILKAEESLAEGEYLEGFRNYYRYVQLRPKEEEARIKMANCAVEIIKSGDATLTIEERQHAYRMLDQTVRRTDDPGLRRELARIVGPIEAVNHIKDLLEGNPHDSELNSMLVRSLFRSKKFDQVKEVAFDLIGYDKKADEFKPEKATLEGEPDVYALLAQVLTQRDKEPELARRVVDQMVIANPESAEAYLQKSNFLVGLKEYKESTECLDKAYALDPTDAKILSRQAQVAVSPPNYSDAKTNYLDAITNFEDAADEIDSAAADSSDYRDAKSAFEDAIPNMESAEPSYEESRTAFQQARANFEAAVEKLTASVTSKLSRASELDQTSFSEAQSELAATQQEYFSVLPDPEKAKEYISQGLKEHSDNMIFYKLMAQAEQRLNRTDEALAILDEGLNKFDKARSIDLVVDKIDLLFSQEKYDSVNDEIERLGKLTNSPAIVPIIDFEKARILYSKQRWPEASKELKRLRPLLFNTPKFQAMAGMMLGISYENQGISDLAEEAYRSVLQDYPNHSGAENRLKAVLTRTGQVKPDGAGVELDDIVNKTLELPEAERDWSKIEELVAEVVKDHDLGPAQEKLLRAKILIKREKYSEAKALIREASRIDKEDINVQYTAVLLVLSDPEQGPAAALKLLDLLEKKWGRSLRSIIQRADLIARLGPEDVSEQLRSLLTQAENLTGEEAITEADRLRLYKILGLKFEQLAKVDESREFYEKSAALEPNNLPLRMHLFELAVRERNDEQMAKAQQAVLELVKSEDDPSYILTEVRRRIMSFGRGEIDRAELAKVQLLLDKALKKRPQWHELHITYGQLIIILGQDMNLALKHFDDALEYGPAKSNAVSIQVKLLAEQGLYELALKRMELLREEIRPQLLGKLEAEILLKNGQPDKAFEAAAKLAEGQPNSADMQKWLSGIAQQVGELEGAIAALRSGLQNKPSDPDSWVRLVGLYIEQKKFDKVESVIREAHLACDPEFLPMLTAKYFELLSRWQNAETIYLAVYEDQADNLAVARRLADFYLLWSKKDEANIGKASVYINRVLKAANEGKVEANNPHVVWARQKAARILYAEQDYQQSLKAERLLRQSAVDNKMTTEESELLADILISRNDPRSLLAAEQLLTQLRKEGRLPTKGALQLASILSRTNKWDESKSLLRDLISDNSEDPAIRAAYVNLLIEHGEFSQAERSLERLSSIDPKNASLVELSARLASEQGDQAQLVQLLNSILPNSRSTLNPQQLQQVFSVAQLANRYGAYELAEKLYTLVAQRDPSKTFDLAKFHVYHGDCDEAIVLLKRLFSDRMDDVAQLANRMLTARRDEIGDKFDKDVDRLIDEAVRDDPESITRQLARAEAYQTQGKHEQSIATYDKLLKRDDLPTQFRAMAMNNLGFQLGLLNQRVDEAEQLVNEAIDTFGPVEDMLDTRAVVRIAQEKYDLAIEDMQLALSVSQDPIKYFHLAKACILAGDGEAALDAWEKAKKLGFEKVALPPLEQTTFEQIVQKIEAFRGQNAKL